MRDQCAEEPSCIEANQGTNAIKLKWMRISQYQAHVAKVPMANYKTYIIL